MELIDPDSRVVFLDLTVNGIPVAHPEDYLGTCVWKDEGGNVVSTDYIFRDAVPGATYTVSVSIAPEKVLEYALPYKTGTVTLDSGKTYANLQLPLSIVDYITVKGFLPQAQVSQFDARFVTTKEPHELVSYAYQNFYTGEFSVQLPAVDCMLVLTANEESPYTS